MEIIASGRLRERAADAWALTRSKTCTVYMQQVGPNGGALTFSTSGIARHESTTTTDQLLGKGPGYSA